MDTTDKRKEELNNEVQKLEAKIILHNLAEKQKALKTLEPKSHPIWLLITSIGALGLIYFIISYYYGHVQSRDGFVIALLIVYIIGVQVALFHLKKHMNATSYLIADIEKEIGDIKSILMNK